MEDKIDGNVKVWENDFVIAKSNIFHKNTFANIQDDKEITVVIENDKIKKGLEKINKNWKLLTFNIELSFEMVGFMSKISNALANNNISIFVISSYSTDHILVKKKDLNKTIKCLQNLGFKVA